MVDEIGFCSVKSIEEIAEQNFILTPGRYIGLEIDEDDEFTFDEKMKALSKEISELFNRNDQLEKEIKKKLGEIGYEV